MAEDQDPDSKTEEPSSKRLSEAREKGQVPKTQELNHIFMLGAGLILITGVLPWSFGNILRAITPFIEQPHAMPVKGGELGGLILDLALKVGLALIVPFVILIVAVILASVVQVGWMFTTENVFNFDLNRLNPLPALAQKFSGKNLIEFGKSLAKLTVVSIVVFFLLRPLWGSVEHFIDLSLMDMVLQTRDLAARMIFTILIILGVVAGADYFYQRYTFMQSMRMTKQELKDEFKQQEGDPLIKGKIRQMRMERARNRMMANVPKADVVVTNPTHYAVALKYDPASMGAPTVLAMGVDAVALRIREIANEHDIPIIENPPLARALYATAEVNHEIPADHYKAVAQVISYVFKLKRRTIPS